MDKAKIHKNETMSKIKGKDTSIEIKLRKAHWNEGIRYRKNYKGLPGTPDIALTKYRIAIFCDSEFWHGKDWEILKPRLENGGNGAFWVNKINRNRNRDIEVDKKLLFLDWIVLHFWGKEILSNTQECVKTVYEAIQERLFEDKGDL